MEAIKETTMSEETVHMQIGKELEQLRQKITDNKPNDRSDADRNYVIVLTDLQKVAAFWMVYCQRMDEQ
jgi:anaerobic ribonucleoside-triphosphate reductase